MLFNRFYDVRAVWQSCVSAGGVKAIAAGDWHSMVLKNNGDVWTTGFNRYGQLGDGTFGGGNDKDEFAFVIGTWDIGMGNTLLGVRAKGLGLRLGLE